ncbi:unnamed protein product [Orchesella dallaii]|uniref:Uncharacterized protein n=1 Tax=Orchesella dallaii TaxID=48710 RepID=A0ABP1QTC3_9HEXA
MIENDNLDLELSAIAETLEDKNRKRGRSDDTLDEGKENKRSSSLNSLSERLTEIDCTQELSIFDVIRDYATDPIVKEYADKLTTLGFFPTAPSQKDDLYRVSEPLVKVTLSPFCHKEVISALMHFFRINYFKNNISDASKEEKAVVPIKAKIFMPCFQLSPEEYLKRELAIKHQTALLLQKNAYVMAKFNAELLIIRSAFRIFCEVRAQVTSVSCQQVSTQKLFEVHFLKARMEFIKTFKVKIIDWKNFENKICLVLPRWRKENLTAPESIPNFYAKDIWNRIDNGTESFKCEDVKNEYLRFINTPSPIPKPIAPSQTTENTTPVASTSKNTQQASTTANIQHSSSSQQNQKTNSNSNLLQLQPPYRKNFTFKKKGYSNIPTSQFKPQQNNPDEPPFRRNHTASKTTHRLQHKNFRGLHSPPNDVNTLIDRTN